MHMSTSLIDATEAFVKQHLADETTGHDWWHAERVRNTARKLHEAEGGDWQIIELAVLLHDVGDRKVIGALEDDPSIARGFLQEQHVPEETIAAIMHIIEHMSYSKSLDKNDVEKSTEFHIVQDADRLDALGAIGIARAFAFGGSRGRPLYDPSREAQEYTSAIAYKQSEGSTLHHFEEKLFKLKDLLNTATARQVAESREAYMRQFVQQFLDEWNGIL